MTTAGFSTRAIHVGSEPDPSTGAIIPPISLSTTFAQSAIGKHRGYEYSRSQNPSRYGLEQTLAALEDGGAHALAFASGSATTATIVQSLGNGAHVLSVNDVYGGTYRYLANVATAQGVQTTFVDLEQATDEEIVSAIIPGKTKLVWIETPTNPTLRIIDISHIVSLLRTHFPNSSDRPLILVDNTFASPYYSSPLKHGVDIALHSLTKYVNGHSDVVGGALIFPPHHAALHQRLTYLQNAIGAVPSAFDAWLVQRGAKTLAVRMKEHGLNALRLARFLETSPHVEQVIYPGLPSHPRHEVARRHLSEHAKKWIKTLPEEYREGGFPFSGMLSFRIREGGREAEKFLQSSRYFALAESLGGVESLGEVPDGMTHGSIPVEQRLKLGITPSLVRLSVGIEDVEDLIEDVRQALQTAVSSKSGAVDLELLGGSESSNPPSSGSSCASGTTSEEASPLTSRDHSPERPARG